jgi:hypothetical protein
MGVGLPLDAQISAGTSDTGVQPASDSSIPVEAVSAGEVANGQSGQPVSSNIAPIWLQRLSLFVLVLFCVYLGVLVMVLPWWPKVWDQNQFIEARPALAALLHTGAMRGLVSGLGLIDIWIGISEAVHYRDHRA